MSDKQALQVAPRTVLGKTVKNLRRQGILPANIYGRGIDSVAVQTDAKAFSHFIHGDTIRGVFQLQIEGEKKPRNVILRALTRAGGTGEPIHVDFLQVQPDRPVEFTVPLEFVGESPAVRDLAGVLVELHGKAKVRCLPGDIPPALPVDIGLLKGYGQTITMGDLIPPKGVLLLNKPDMGVATVAPPRAARAR